MPQSLANVLIHIVFSTKDRQPLISPALAPELHRYIGGVCGKRECTPHQIGGVADHVHIACNLHRTSAIADLVKDVKLAGTKWMRDHDVRRFAWQGGYSVFSFGEPDKPRVVEYIHRQEEHHRKRSFQEEVLALLAKYNVSYDERYLWD